MIVRLGRAERLLLAALLLLALAQSLIVMITAWAVQHIFDGLGQTPAQGRPSAPFLIAAFVGGAGAAFLIEIAKRRLAAEMGLRYAASLRLALFNRQISANPYRPGNKGTALLPFVGDLTAVRRWVSEGLARGAAALVLIPSMLLVIALRNAPLAGALAAVLLLSIACSGLLIAPLDRAVRDVRKRRGALASFIAGRIEAASTIRASGRAATEARKVEARTNKLSDAERRRAWVVGATRGLAHLTSSMLVLAALVVGMVEGTRGQTTPGAIAAVLSLVGLLSAGVTDLIRALELRQPAAVSLERIDRVLSRPLRSRNTVATHTAPATGLALSDFAIPDLIEPASLSLQRGARIAVEGNSGAGKSRLLAAIAQASHDHSGTVTFDGKNLKTMSAKRRSSVIGFASVELPLLPGSLGMNLRYAKPGMSDDALIQLARQCGLGPLLSRLGGLDGKLSTPDLSSGERQALALARALAGTPPVLLLDAIDGRLDSGPLDWLRGQLAEYPGIVLFVSARAEMDALATGTWRLSGRQLRPGPPPPGSNILRFERPQG